MIPHDGAAQSAPLPPHLLPEAGAIAMECFQGPQLLLLGIRYQCISPYTRLELPLFFPTPVPRLGLCLIITRVTSAALNPTLMSEDMLWLLLVVHAAVSLCPTEWDPGHDSGPSFLRVPLLL